MCIRDRYEGDDKELPFALGDYVFVPGVRKAIADKDEVIKAYAVKADGTKMCIRDRARTFA